MIANGLFLTELCARHLIVAVLSFHVFIFQYAFNWINPFPMRFIASRRQQHLKDIKVS